MTIEEVAIKYNDIYHETSLEETIASFSKIPGNIISSSNEKMSVIFLRLSSDAYKTITRNPNMLLNKLYMVYLFGQSGNNIHLIKAFGSGFKEFREIIQNIKKMYKPKTLTWFKDGFTRLHRVRPGG